MSVRSLTTIPSALRGQVAGYAFERTALGKAAETYRLTMQGGPTRYLKIGNDLEREHERLRWEGAHLTVPRVLAFAREPSDQYLLLDELPGTPIALAAELSVAQRVAHLAHTMRVLHSLPLDDCPFDQRLERRLIDADANVRAGSVNEKDFDPERIGRSAESILSELRAWHPFMEDLVVTHGDFTFANIFVNPAGMLDLGRLGVADRYQDIALVLRDIEGDYGWKWVDAFRAAYGLEAIDESKRSFFRLLDELF